MPEPSVACATTPREVTSWIRGEGPATHLPQQPSPYPVPVHLAALTSQNVELAGEIADGVMPIWWSVERLTRKQDLGRARPRQIRRPRQIGDDARPADL